MNSGWREDLTSQLFYLFVLFTVSIAQQTRRIYLAAEHIFACIIGDHSKGHKIYVLQSQMLYLCVSFFLFEYSHWISRLLHMVQLEQFERQPLVPQIHTNGMEPDNNCHVIFMAMLFSTKHHNTLQPKLIISFGSVYSLFIHSAQKHHFWIFYVMFATVFGLFWQVRKSRNLIQAISLKPQILNGTNTCTNAQCLFQLS